jgi:hypothetical protein
MTKEVIVINKSDLLLRMRDERLIWKDDINFSLSRKGRKKFRRLLGIGKFDYFPYKNDLMNLLSIPFQKLISFILNMMGMKPRKRRKVIISLFNWDDDGIVEFSNILLLRIKKMDVKTISKRQRYSRVKSDDTYELFISCPNTFIKSPYRFRALEEDKIEGKNIILNRWAIIQTIRLFNEIYSIYPTRKNIAEANLFLYDEIRSIDPFTLKKWVEGRISKDIAFLEENEYIKPIRDGRYHYYRLNL